MLTLNHAEIAVRVTWRVTITKEIVREVRRYVANIALKLRHNPIIQNKSCNFSEISLSIIRALRLKNGRKIKFIIYFKIKLKLRRICVHIILCEITHWLNNNNTNNLFEIGNFYLNIMFWQEMARKRSIEEKIWHDMYRAKLIKDLQIFMEICSKTQFRNF